MYTFMCDSEISGLIQTVLTEIGFNQLTIQVKSIRIQWDSNQVS